MLENINNRDSESTEVGEKGFNHGWRGFARMGGDGLSFYFPGCRQRRDLRFTLRDEGEGGLTGSQVFEEKCLIKNFCSMRSFVFVLFCFACEKDLSAQEYRVQGVSTWNIYRSNVVSQSQTQAFQVSVTSNLWNIKVRSEVLPFYRESAYDGRFVYYMHVFREPAHHIGKQVANSMIFADRRMPHADFSPEMNAIWLAYASSDYFKSRTSDRLEPGISWLTPGIERILQSTNRLNKAKWELSRQKPFLPLSITYLDDGLIYSWSSKVPPKKMLRPFDNGYTNITYNVVSTTNLNNHLFPTEVIVRRYQPSKTNLNLHLEFTVTATNTTFDPGREILPRLQGVTGVSEWRFGKNAMTYFITNRWLQSEDILVSPGFQKKLTPPVQNRPGTL